MIWAKQREREGGGVEGENGEIFLKNAAVVDFRKNLENWTFILRINN